jgi:L-alanine-DL-glutamate epimerase-like enolase superfamily enzyme
MHWDSTTVVVVRVHAGADEGLGFSYGSAAMKPLIDSEFRDLVAGRPVDHVGEAWEAMVRSARNLGRPGLAAHAISAVDIALWDLRARVHDVPLYRLLSVRRTRVPVYGSGGFTSYSVDELTEQLGGWVGAGIPRVKMKIGKDGGTRAGEDLERIAAARAAIGSEAQLFVDANGAYDRKQVERLAPGLSDLGVTYFEEPVSSDRLEDLRALRDSTPFDIAAGEYGYDPWYYWRMLRAGCVDIVQADVTRCLGISGWLEVAQLAHAGGVRFSAHTCPSVHAHVACAAPSIEHVEYFWDHVRVESLLFEGTPTAGADGCIAPPDRPGLGFTLRAAGTEKWRIA